MYNPQAGTQEVPVADIVAALIQKGATVVAQCTKVDDYAKALEKTCDFILIAGGDGTVGKVVKLIVDKQVPIAILPFGNANNIANSLEVDTALNAIIRSWQQENFKNFSIGTLVTDQKKEYFLESVGWGLFADVLSAIKAKKRRGSKKHPGKTKRKVEEGLNHLSKAISKMQASHYKIILDGNDHSGNYLWVEVMNIRSMGPQLLMAPEAHHGDEFLDVVLVREGEEESLSAFIHGQGNGESNHFFQTIKAKQIQIHSSEIIHIDDEIQNQNQEVLNPSQWYRIDLVDEHFRVINA